MQTRPDAGFRHYSVNRQRPHPLCITPSLGVWLRLPIRPPNSDFERAELRWSGRTARVHKMRPSPLTRRHPLAAAHPGHNPFPYLLLYSTPFWYSTHKTRWTRTYAPPSATALCPVHPLRPLPSSLNIHQKRALVRDGFWIAFLPLLPSCCRRSSRPAVDDSSVLPCAAVYTSSTAYLYAYP